MRCAPPHTLKKISSSTTTSLLPALFTGQGVCIKGLTSLDIMPYTFFHKYGISDQDI